jgi:Domain of unknown function (DUF5666)
MKRLLVFCVLLSSIVVAAQNPPAPGDRPHRGEGRGPWAGQGIAGTIVNLTDDGFTLKNMQGNTVTVKVGADARLMRDGQAVKLSDFKPGEMVMVRGQQAGEGTWKAEAVMSRPAAAERMREGMGKEFIVGEVKAVDGLKLSIARPDGQTQSIEVSENTSFRQGRESITLPDIKVGDHVFGRGKLNEAGVFVPEVLNVGEPGMMGGMGPGGRMGRGRPGAPPPPPPQ